MTEGPPYDEDGKGKRGKPRADVVPDVKGGVEEYQQQHADDEEQTMLGRLVGEDFARRLKKESKDNVKKPPVVSSAKNRTKPASKKSRAQPATAKSLGGLGAMLKAAEEESARTPSRIENKMPEDAEGHGGILKPQKETEAQPSAPVSDGLAAIKKEKKSQTQKEKDSSKKTTRSGKNKGKKPVVKTDKEILNAFMVTQNLGPVDKEVYQQLMERDDVTREAIDKMTPEERKEYLLMSDKDLNKNLRKDLHDKNTVISQEHFQERNKKIATAQVAQKATEQATKEVAAEETEDKTQKSETVSRPAHGSKEGGMLNTAVSSGRGEVANRVREALRESGVSAKEVNAMSLEEQWKLLVEQADEPRPTHTVNENGEQVSIAKSKEKEDVLKDENTKILKDAKNTVEERRRQNAASKRRDTPPAAQKTEDKVKPDDYSSGVMGGQTEYKTSEQDPLAKGKITTASQAVGYDGKEHSKYSSVMQDGRTIYDLANAEKEDIEEHAEITEGENVETKDKKETGIKERKRGTGLYGGRAKKYTAIEKGKEEAEQKKQKQVPPSQKNEKSIKMKNVMPDSSLVEGRVIRQKKEDIKPTEGHQELREEYRAYREKVIDAQDAYLVLSTRYEEERKEIGVLGRMMNGRELVDIEQSMKEAEQKYDGLLEGLRDKRQERIESLTKKFSGKLGRSETEIRAHHIARHEAIINCQVDNEIQQLENLRFNKDEEGESRYAAVRHAKATWDWYRKLPVKKRAMVMAGAAGVVGGILGGVGVIAGGVTGAAAITAARKGAGVFTGGVAAAETKRVLDEMTDTYEEGEGKKLKDEFAQESIGRGRAKRRALNKDVRFRRHAGTATAAGAAIVVGGSVADSVSDVVPGTSVSAPETLAEPEVPESADVDTEVGTGRVDLHEGPHLSDTHISQERVRELATIVGIDPDVDTKMWIEGGKVTINGEDVSLEFLTETERQEVLNTEKMSGWMDNANKGETHVEEAATTPETTDKDTVTEDTAPISSEAEDATDLPEAAPMLGENIVTTTPLPGETDFYELRKDGSEYIWYKHDTAVPSEVSEIEFKDIPSEHQGIIENIPDSQMSEEISEQFKKFNEEKQVPEKTEVEKNNNASETGENVEIADLVSQVLGTEGAHAEESAVLAAVPDDVPEEPGSSSLQPDTIDAVPAEPTPDSGLSQKVEAVEAAVVPEKLTMEGSYEAGSSVERELQQFLKGDEWIQEKYPDLTDKEVGAIAHRVRLGLMEDPSAANELKVRGGDWNKVYKGDSYSYEIDRALVEKEIEAVHGPGEAQIPEATEKAADVSVKEESAAVESTTPVAEQAEEATSVSEVKEEPSTNDLETDEWKKEENQPLIQEIREKDDFIREHHFQERYKDPTFLYHRLEGFGEEVRQEMQTGSPENVSDFLDIKLGQYALTEAWEHEKAGTAVPTEQSTQAIHHAPLEKSASSPVSAAENTGTEPQEAAVSAAEEALEMQQPISLKEAQEVLGEKGFDWQGLETRNAIDYFFDEKMFEGRLDVQKPQIQSNWGTISHASLTDILDHNGTLTYAGENGEMLTLNSNAENLAKSLVLQLEKMEHYGNVLDTAEKLGHELTLGDLTQQLYEANNPDLPPKNFLK